MPPTGCSLLVQELPILGFLARIRSVRNTGGGKSFGRDFAVGKTNRYAPRFSPTLAAGGARTSGTIGTDDTNRLRRCRKIHGKKTFRPGARSQTGKKRTLSIPLRNPDASNSWENDPRPAVKKSRTGRVLTVFVCATRKGGISGPFFVAPGRVFDIHSDQRGPHCARSLRI